jgi:hypothetical protein
MRLSLSALPLALIAATPALAAVQPAEQTGDEAAVVSHSDGSFTIIAAIEPYPDELDSLPGDMDQIDGRGDGSRGPRGDADEALEEAFEEAEDSARTEAGPD